MCYYGTLCVPRFRAVRHYLCNHWLFPDAVVFFLSGYVVSVAPTWKKCGKKVVNFMLPMIWVGIAFAYFSHGTITDWVKTPFKYGYWYLSVLSVF